MLGAIEKYNRRVDNTNSLLCAGLDPDLERLPEQFQRLEFPQFEFNKWIINQTAEYVAAYKPNMAFYEARGDMGVRELKMTMEYLKEHHPDILTICDAKRADIGSTNQQYANAIFDHLGFDAVTLHPYLGRDALKPFLKRKEKGCVILCRTSNPGAGEIQDLLVDGKPLWHAIAKMVTQEWNTNENCMLVVGATYPKELRVVRELVGDMTLLVPGVGAQGGDVKTAVQAGVDSQGKGLIISTGRAILFAKNPGQAARSFRDEINRWRT